MITESQFANINPKSIPPLGGHTADGSALLYTYAITPTLYAILGASFPYTSLNNLNIRPNTFGTISIRLSLPSGSTIIDKEFAVKDNVILRKSDWVYFRLYHAGHPLERNLITDCTDSWEQLLTPYTASNDQIYRHCSSLTYFNPDVQGSVNFANSDDNPLLSNATVLRNGSNIYEVNRYRDAVIPTNLSAILNNTATQAAVQDSNYTDTAWTNARYEGTENSTEDLVFSGSLVPEPPALSIKPFKAEVFELTADITTITTASKAERNIETLYFRPALNSSSFSYNYSTATTASYPSSGQSEVVYREDNNRLVRLANKKFYVVENSAVLTTDESGTAS